MSKWKSSSSSKKGNARAGLQFDRLLKACSNSKKPPAAMAAGALGRFGVPQFTSTRSILEKTGEEELQDKGKGKGGSRFSSLNNKGRARLERLLSQEPPPTLQMDSMIPPPPTLTSSSSSGYGSGGSYPYMNNNSEGPPPCLQPQVQTILKPRKFFKSRGPMEVDVSLSESRPLRPDVSNMIPQYPIQQTPPPPPLSNKSFNNESNKKKATTKKGRGALSGASCSSKDTSFVSPPPPLKLKIFKDKLTSKFVSVAEGEGGEGEGGVEGSNNKGVIKEQVDPTPPGKRGRKRQHSTTNNSVGEQISSSPLPKGRGRPPKKRRSSPSPSPPPEDEVDTGEAKKKKPLPPPNPKRAAGRVTRASVLYQDQNQNNQEQENKGEEEEEQNQGGEGGVRRNSEEIMKKLEEDAEFQKISQMLASMEEGSPPLKEEQLPPPLAPPPAPPPPAIKEPEAPPPPRDIRSILEDDWNESFEEESPKKTANSSSSQFLSPPKVSRFDPSAFMSSEGEEEEEEVRRDIREEDVEEGVLQQRPFEIQRPIPLYPQHNETSREPPPQSFNSSPYAMKNLLSEPHPHLEDEQGQGQEEQKNSEEILADSQSLSQTSEISEPLSQQIQSCSQGPPGSTTSSATSSPVKSSSQQTRKASIFKTRAASNAKKAVYKHTFGQIEEEEEGNKSSSKAAAPAGKIFEDFEDEEEEEDLRLMRRSQGQEGSGSGPSGGGGSGGSDQDSSDGKVFCKKGVKKLFTVVRNVKAGHELQESGEFHEFDGDIMYILEDLKDKNPMNSRCLSAITLASRCMDQAFRMHLRAHGTVAEFCKELYDAPQHPVLSLLAATVLFVLSQDRLNMDLDTESLKLILALTKADSSSSKEVQESLETVKNRQRVMQLCEEMKNRGHAKHLNLEKITASELALETLLYLTSKRAGEWVKHELRMLGGLDSIVGEVESSFNIVKREILGGRWEEEVTERMRKIDRCLGVLGQVTFNHEDNQKYLMQVGTREVEGGGPPVKCMEASPKVFLEMFKFCQKVVVGGGYGLGTDQLGMIREILFLVLRLLVNLSHDYRGIVLGSEIMMKMEGFLELSLHSIFEMTRKFPDDKVFDLLMHSLCLLLNLVEISRSNRTRILEMTIKKNPASGGYRIPVGGDDDNLGEEPPPDLDGSNDSGVEDEVPVLDAFTQMFLQRERSAKKEEQHTDNILTTGEKDEKDKEKREQANKQDPLADQEGSSVQDTIDKLIQTAGKHMENSLIAAYISLLIAFLVMDDVNYVEKVRESMPAGNLLPLMIMLKKLFNFMSITSSASGSNRGLKATATALKFYAKMDAASAEELKKIIPE